SPDNVAHLHWRRTPFLHNCFGFKPLIWSNSRYLAQTDMNQVLAGATPRLIDEWQLIPEIWDAVRFTVDQRAEDGQFILTGSAVPPQTDKISHTGTGRFAWLTMRPMTLWESGDSNGSVSLQQMFRNNQEPLQGTNSLDLPKIAHLICRGGWPQTLNKRTANAQLVPVREYFEAVVRSDISRADGVTRNEERARRLMRSYARHQGTQATLGTLLADVKVNNTDTLTEDTVQSYLNALRKIFVIEDMAAWSPNLRSKTALRTSDTRYFVDPSIATAALGVGPEDLIDDINTLGLLFETLCVRDLRVYAEAIGGRVYHYRDKTGLECDAVIHLRNGRYGLVEIKLGGEALINEAVASLNKLENRIDTDKLGRASFKMVLTAVGQYAYRRPDGVCIVPVGCLRP
ncbi:MAG: ATP-binding protein, partial [bacterium]|nr:ATP-binding protein [Candidatus Limimorpha caballi]